MYIAMGMTPDQFWYGDTRNIRAYREAFKLGQRMRDEQMWVLGQYFVCAIAAVPSFGRQAVKYPEMPFTASSDEEMRRQREIQEEQASRDRIEAFKASFRRRHGEAPASDNEE